VSLILTASLNVSAGTAEDPDMALLEFIGEGARAGDELVDPMAWQDMQEMQAGDQKAQQKTRQTLPPQTDKEKSGHD